ncbi:MAG: glycosyltransferase [Bacteroidetes bacterium]|nr:glycosyltransferase [Bacteroidota bacterium]
MYKKYLSDGIENAIFSPFGFNKNIYKKIEMEKIYNVSFIGGYSPLRDWIIMKLKKKGINVNVFGRGWNNEKSWLTEEEMVKVINQTKINLNLSNAVSYHLLFLIWSLHSPRAVKELLLLRKTVEQVKGRHYEINGCGGFQLSYNIPGLEIAFEIDKEIAVYDSLKNLPQRIKYFLDNENERESIALNGYNRAARDHSAQNYMQQLINKVLG